MRKLFTIILFLSITIGLSANPVSVGFQSMEATSLPVEIETEKEPIDITSKKLTTETASLFDSTYAIALFGLIAIYMLLLRKRESRGMNL